MPAALTDRLPPHPIEDRLRASIAAALAATRQNMHDLSRVTGLRPQAVSRRLRGLTPWGITETGHLSSHWRMDLRSLYAGPSEALNDLGLTDPPEGWIPGSPSHPAEDILRRNIRACLDATGQTMKALGWEIGMRRPQLISRRQLGYTPWKVLEIGHVSTHWHMEVCPLFSQDPDGAVAAMHPDRLNELRQLNGLPVFVLA